MSILTIHSVVGFVCNYWLRYFYYIANVTHHIISGRVPCKVEELQRTLQFLGTRRELEFSGFKVNYLKFRHCSII